MLLGDCMEKDWLSEALKAKDQQCSKHNWCYPDDNVHKFGDTMWKKKISRNCSAGFCSDCQTFMQIQNLRCSTASN